MPRRALLAAVLLAGLVSLAYEAPVGAQTSGDPWGEPVNLSRSGAASAPQIVAGFGDSLQAFWWDEFDGLTTAYYRAGAWSEPAQAPLLAEVQVAADEFVLMPVAAMPRIYSDGTGWLHAFWIGEPDLETHMTPFLRSQMRVQRAVWSPSVLVAESAVSFEASQIPGGGLVVAYVRPVMSDQFPAGIYAQASPGGEGEWSPPASVYQSMYFRMMTAEAAHVRLSAGHDSQVFLGWRDPYAGHDFFAFSLDGGGTWSEPERLGAANDGPSGRRVFPLPDGGALRMWEVAAEDACAMHQQRMESAAGVDLKWSAVEPAIDGLGACPHGEEGYWPSDEALFWVWGQGSPELTLVAWDVGRARWSNARSVSLGFEDEQRGRWIDLADLQATRVVDRLAIVGSGEGDIWAFQKQIDAIQFTFSPGTPWLPLARISGPDVWAGWPAVAVDDLSVAHVVWPESPMPGGVGTSLSYARWSAAGGRVYGPIEMVRGSPYETMVRHPALAVDRAGVLHLVWSGGSQGEILYSRAKVDEAGQVGGWSNPRALPMISAVGSWPQIAIDGAGGLVVAYLVPLNEARGVYTTRSPDGDDSWTAAEVAFDAEEAGWAMVDQLSLAAAEDGSLHIAWVKAAPPDSWRPHGIYYALSNDGSTWSEPIQIAGPGSQWPRLVSQLGIVHLVYTSSEGGAWHRASPVGRASEAAGWSPAVPVPGFEWIEGPLAIAAGGGGAIHLLGGGGDRESVVHSSWDGQRWIARSGILLGPSVGGVMGVAGTTGSEHSVLALAARSLSTDAGDLAPVIMASLREVVGESGLELPSPEPEAKPTAEAPPTVTRVEEEAAVTAPPGPTPNLSAIPEGSTSPLGPLMIGGGLAALVVVGLLLARSLRGRARR